MKKIVLFASLKSLKKGVGSEVGSGAGAGSISWRYGSSTLVDGVMLCAGGPAEGPGGGGGGAELPDTEGAAGQVPRLRAAQARPRGEQARRPAAPGRPAGPPGHGNNNNNKNNKDLLPHILSLIQNRQCKGTVQRDGSGRK